MLNAKCLIDSMSNVLMSNVLMSNVLIDNFE